MAELDRTEEWFRALLMQLLGWGAATFLVMAGWLISGGVEFSFFTGDKEDFYRAFALFFFAAVFWLVWLVAVVKVRLKCPDHPTVLAKSLVFAYAASMLVCVSLLLFLVLND